MKKLLTFVICIPVFLSPMSYTHALDVESVIVTTGESRIEEKTEAEEWVDKGNNAYDANDYDEAIKCYKKAADLDPNLVNAHYNLGVIYGKKEMLDNAIAEYNKVLAINPRYYAAHNNLGAVYMKKGRLDAAIATLKKALDINPDLPHVHYNLGRYYATKGSHALAADHFYKAGVFFVGRGEKDWAQKSYEGLQETNSPELEKSLLEKMNEAPAIKDGFLEQFIEITPKEGSLTEGTTKEGP